MSTELAPLNQNVQLYTGERFELEQRMAKLFAMSGLFTDIKGSSQEMAIAQAYVKIALGSSMGFSPAESMQGIDIIQGRPAIGAQLRAARMQRAGYSWRIDRLDDEGCELSIFAGTSELGKAKFTKDDAAKAKLIDKDNYKKDPSSMYFARAITRAQRRYAPGVLSLDVMSSEEAIDYPEPASISAATATDNKTEELAKKLEAKRQPAPVQTAPVSITESARQSAGQEPPIATTDNPWPARIEQTFLATLGEKVFNNVLMKTTGSKMLYKSVTKENYKAVWDAMRAALGTEKDPNSITTPELAPAVKDGLF
jgi:hypothetical protein